MALPGERIKVLMKKVLAVLLGLMMMAGGYASAKAEGSVQVVTSFYPIYIFASNVLAGVEGVELKNLTHPTTGCLHDYQLLASDMVTLSRADALIINGGGMESFVPMVQTQYPQLPLIDTSEGIELLLEDELLEEGHSEDDGHDHDHGEFNAHIWLDPQNAIKMTAHIAREMAALMPDQAQKIEENAAAYSQKLEALDQELREELSGLENRDIVTFHEAFPYFAKAYDLNVVAVLALEPDEALTPQMLKGLVEKVKEAGLPPLFTEPQFEDRAAKAVAQETGAKIYELDPIVTGEGQPDAYETGMRKNAQALIEALGE